MACSTFFFFSLLGFITDILLKIQVRPSRKHQQPQIKIRITGVWQTGTVQHQMCQLRQFGTTQVVADGLVSQNGIRPRVLQLNSITSYPLLIKKRKRKKGTPRHALYFFKMHQKSVHEVHLIKQASLWPSKTL